MRVEPRFKTFLKSKLAVFSCPNKILQFKRTKWANLKKNIKKNLKRRFFFNYKLNSAKTLRWDKKKSLYKNRLLIRRRFNQNLDSVLNKKFLINKNKSQKMNMLYNSFFNHSILKFEFALCVFLFKLNFYTSIYKAKNEILNGNVLVNGRHADYKYFLKMGDVIFLKQIPNYSKNIKETTKMSIYASFIEADFYTNSFVVVKSLKDLSISDVALALGRHTNLPKIYWALQKN